MEFNKEYLEKEDKDSKDYNEFDKADTTIITSNYDKIINFNNRFGKTHEIFYHGQNTCHMFKDIIANVLFNEEHYYINDDNYNNKNAKEIYDILNSNYNKLPIQPDDDNDIHTEIYRFQGDNTIPATLDDHHQLLGKLSIACLKEPYGNKQNYNESVIKYLQKTDNCNRNIICNHSAIIKLLNKHIGNIKINYKKLEEILEEFLKEVDTTQLVMFAIPKEKINNYVYESKVKGVPINDSAGDDVYRRSTGFQYRIINLNMSKKYLEENNIYIEKINNLDDKIREKYIKQIEGCTV